jgi:hypothetical protein
MTSTEGLTAPSVRPLARRRRPGSGRDEPLSRGGINVAEGEIVHPVVAAGVAAPA